MKSSRFEFLCYIVAPFLVWMFIFRDFLMGSIPLTADAISYFQHIGFYTDNLSQGHYPLWNPFWFDGAPYHFFLRRIGDVNPFFFIIIFLKWLGISHTYAYLIFLSVYYFLTMLAFYLIARLLLKDSFFAFVAYLLLMFSSWGSELFYNYIILIFLPIIWFFYFLLAFAQKGKKSQFLGVCFCLALIVTTYIPFYFLIILSIFIPLFAVIYWKLFLVFLKQTLSFTRFNKLFVGFCMFFLMAACVPALIFYQESKGGEFVLPNRHSGALHVSAVAVGLTNVASGDIINNGSFDRLFVSHHLIGLGEVYIPHIFFLLLLCSLIGRVNKLMFFLFFNILVIASIASTSAVPIYKFLYEHVVIFKFIRNIYYFFWLAVLPMAILMVIAGFKSLLESIEGKSIQGFLGWVYICMCHIAFGLFLFSLGGEVSWGTITVIFISLTYFSICFWGHHKIVRLAGFLLIAGAVFVQSFEVYGYVTSRLEKTINPDAYNKDEYSQYLYKQQVNRTVPVQGAGNREEFVKNLQFDLYYAASGFAFASRHIDPAVFNAYKSRKFLFVDNVYPQEDDPGFFKILEEGMANGSNIAYVPRAESNSSDWRSQFSSIAKAELIEEACKKLTVVHFDSDSMQMKVNLSRSQFLVINDNYNTGWNAYVNGKKVKLLRANVAFKGLWIPAGESIVELHFLTGWRHCMHFLLIALFFVVFIYLIVLSRKERLK